MLADKQLEVSELRGGEPGELDTDLHRAALRALTLDPESCRQHALRFGWDVSTRELEGNLVLCRSGAQAASEAAAAPGQPAAG